HAPAVLLAEEDHPGHEVVQVGRAEGPRPSHVGPGILAGSDEIDVGLAVDLAASEEEGADPSLADQVEDLDATVGEAVVAARAQDGQPHRRLFTLLRKGPGEQGARTGDRRTRAHGDMPDAPQQPGDREDEPFDGCGHGRPDPVLRPGLAHAGCPAGSASRDAHGASVSSEASMSRKPWGSRAAPT